jgi:hypothetical protein
MGDARIVGIKEFEKVCLPLVEGALGVFKQRLVTGEFDAEDKADVSLL